MTSVIVAKRLTKRYGRIVAVDELDLSVPKGAVFGLLGPNGAGKSSTFGMLCGYLRPDAGEASILDTPSTELARLRGQVATMPQDAAFPRRMSIERQLAFYARLVGLAAADARREVARVLDCVELGAEAARRGGELSHGMLKRVALAQALIGEPKVLLLDEPTAGLDPAAARRVKDLIASLAPRSTVVISSHNLAEIQEICTHGAILDHGKRVRFGTIAELTKLEGEITVELAEGAEPPLAALTAQFGAESIGVIGRRTLRIRCQSGQDPQKLVDQTLRLLLEHGTPIVSVQRGTSLERAFLAATGDSED